MAYGEMAHVLTADTFDSTRPDDKLILHTRHLQQAQSAGRKEKSVHSDGGQEVEVDGRQEVKVDGRQEVKVDGRQEVKVDGRQEVNVDGG
jgi:hypothetical protein